MQYPFLKAEPTFTSIVNNAKSMCDVFIFVAYILFSRVVVRKRHTSGYDKTSLPVQFALERGWWCWLRAAPALVLGKKSDVNLFLVRICDVEPIKDRTVMSPK